MFKKPQHRPPPRSRSGPLGSGHLYYVRLKTHIGTLYKLGYTSLSSVEQRIGFQGTGDDRLIDKVLFFHYFDNASGAEFQLHTHFASMSLFGKFSAIESMPLCNNGQSELYAEDILKLDDQYDAAGAKLVRQKVRDASGYRPPTGISKWINDNKVAEKTGTALGFALSIVIIPLIVLVTWLFETKEQKARAARERKNQAIRRLAPAAPAAPPRRSASDQKTDVLLEYIRSVAGQA